ncbi:MAG: hypothetical protein JOZ75_10860 [Candidatus Dormibacteraeota bacterium]|nr:hypothetical protein [Candidatus Dormibacteraeota bacterium]
MATIASLDPAISTGYVVGPQDLVRRFGVVDYFWTRLGFSLPAHGFFSAFGPLPGYFAFRYLLALVAIVPLYLLVRRLAGAGSGWIAVGALLTSSVVITGWSTDYPTSAALSYLIAGACCLFMPAGPRRAQVCWAVVTGLFFGLALGCGLVTALPVAGAVGGRLVASRGARLQSVAAAAYAALGIVVALGVLAVTSKLYLGHLDYLAPQLQALKRFQDPVQIGYFHSSTWRWLEDDVYVLAPLAVLGGWVVSTWPAIRRQLPPAELGIAVATAITYGLYVIDQFVLKSWTLEYWMYADLLWAFSVPPFVLTMLRIAGVTGTASRVPLAAVALAVIATPLVLRVFRDQLHLSFGVAVLLMLAPAAVALAARLVPAIGVRLAAATLVSGATSLLVIAAPVFVVYAGQVGYVTPDLGTALYGTSQPALDEYTVLTRIHTLVPSTQQIPGQLALWQPAHTSRIITLAEALYLAGRYQLQDPLSTLTQADADYLRTHNVPLLLIFSDTGSEFDAAQSSIADSGVGVTVLHDDALRSGSVELHVDVLRLSYGH